jgi:hypothetical protein
VGFEATRANLALEGTIATLIATGDTLRRSAAVVRLLKDKALADELERRADQAVRIAGHQAITRRLPLSANFTGRTDSDVSTD